MISKYYIFISSIISHTITIPLISHQDIPILLTLFFATMGSDFPLFFYKFAMIHDNFFPLYYGLLKNIEYRSLCCIVGPCCLSTLYIIASANPKLTSHPCPGPLHLGNHSLFVSRSLPTVVLYCSASCFHHFAYLELLHIEEDDLLIHYIALPFLWVDVPWSCPASLLLRKSGLFRICSCCK